MSNDPIAVGAYNELAERYSAAVEIKPHNAFYGRPEMLDLLTDVAGRKVLDAGCGSGTYASWLVDPADYAKLMRQPGFICIRANKLCTVLECSRQDSDMRGLILCGYYRMP